MTGARRVAEACHWTVWTTGVVAAVVAGLQGYVGAAFAIVAFVAWVSASALLPCDQPGRSEVARIDKGRPWRGLSLARPKRQ